MGVKGSKVVRVDIEIQFAKQLIISLVCDKSISEVFDNKHLPHYDELRDILLKTIFKNLDEDQSKVIRIWLHKTKAGDVTRNLEPLED